MSTMLEHAYETTCTDTRSMPSAWRGRTVRVHPGVTEPGGTLVTMVPPDWATDEEEWGWPASTAGRTRPTMLPDARAWWVAGDVPPPEPDHWAQAGDSVVVAHRGIGRVADDGGLLVLVTGDDPAFDPIDAVFREEHPMVPESLLGRRGAWYPARSLARVEVYTVTADMTRAEHRADWFHPTWAGRQVTVMGDRALLVGEPGDARVVTGQRMAGRPYWSISAALRDRLRAAGPTPVPTAGSFTVQLDDPPREGTLGYHLPAGWAGQEVTVWRDITRDGGIRTLVTNASGRYGPRVSDLSEETRRMLPHELPEDHACYWVSTERLREWFPEQHSEAATEADTQAATEATTVEQLREQIERESQAHRERMENIAREALRVGRENGYGSQVEAFLEGEGMLPEEEPVEVVATVEIRFRAMPANDDATQNAGSEGFIRRSVILEDRGESVEVTLDSDFEDVEVVDYRVI